MTLNTGINNAHCFVLNLIIQVQTRLYFILAPARDLSDTFTKTGQFGLSALISLHHHDRTDWRFLVQPCNVDVCLFSILQQSTNMAGAQRKKILRAMWDRVQVHSNVQRRYACGVIDRRPLQGCLSPSYHHRERMVACLPRIHVLGKYMLTTVFSRDSGLHLLDVSLRFFRDTSCCDWMHSFVSGNHISYLGAMVLAVFVRSMEVSVGAG